MTSAISHSPSVQVRFSQQTHNRGVTGTSSRKFSDKAEVLTYRQHFAFMWRDFIIENFESPAHAAMVFRVDPSTAENWFAGVNAPQGWVVGRAISNPETRDAAMAVLAGVK